MLLDIFTFESMITRREPLIIESKKRRKTASCKYNFPHPKEECYVLMYNKTTPCQSIFPLQMSLPVHFCSPGDRLANWQRRNDWMTAKQIMNIYRVAAFQHHLSPRLHMGLAAAPLHILSDSHGHSLMFISGHRKGWAMPCGRTHGESASETRSDTQPWHAAILCTPSQTMHEQHGPPSLAQRLAA